VRLFQTDGDSLGVVRAVLSDSYKLIDNLDAPTTQYIPGRNWTPEQARQAAAREGRGYQPGTEPVLFAGFVVSNSEVGDGAWSITPRSSPRSRQRPADHRQM
jgi:hypothetical protein